MLSFSLIRCFSQSSVKWKVSILGASGGIGQPLSLLLKLNPFIQSLSLYDPHRPPATSIDLSHINTPCLVSGFQGESNLPTVLTGSNIVIIPAGIPRKPGMSRDDLFFSNARIAYQLATSCIKYCPEAIILIITNPLNSILPLFFEVYKKNGINGSNQLIGLSNLDSIRASTFISEQLHTIPFFCSIPVIGGHAGTTIIPLFSQLDHQTIAQLDIPSLTKRIQYAGDEVVQAKAGQGSATLSMAYAAAGFTNSVLRAMNGEKDVTEPAFVRQDVKGLHFFASLVKLGMNGVEEPVPIPSKLTLFEKDLLNKAIPVLKEQAQKGIDFVDEMI